MGVKDWAAEVFGQVEKAVIVFKDKRAVTAEVAEPAGISKLTGFAMKMAGNSLAKVTSSPETNGVTERRYTVQFNPNMVSFYCIDNDGTYSPVGSVTGNMISQTQESSTYAKIELDIMLVFDRVNIYDAFMLEKLTNTSLTSIAKGVTTAVAVAKGGGFSVRGEIGGIIAAARNPDLNSIKFCWKDFIFEGVISSAQASYSMFNPEGEPVRGVVRLKISQSIEDGASLTHWRDQFTLAFGGAGFGEFNAESGFNPAGNLLNFTL